MDRTLFPMMLTDVRREYAFYVAAGRIDVNGFHDWDGARGRFLTGYLMSRFSRKAVCADRYFHLLRGDDRHSHFRRFYGHVVLSRRHRNRLKRCN